MKNRPLRLSDQQKSLLHKLLDRHENATSERVVALRVGAERFPEYFDDESPERVRTWEEEMLQLSAQGWIRIEFGRGGEAHRIIRLLLIREADVEISETLGRMTAQDFSKGISALLDESLAAVDSEKGNDPHRELWIAYLEKERKRWREAKITSESRERVLSERKLTYKALRLLLARNTKVEPTSWRQFSVRHFADSKILDHLKTDIVNILYRIAVMQDLELEDDEDVERTSVLADFGVISKERILYMCGPLRLRSNIGELLADGAQWNPFLSIPEGVLDLCEIEPVSVQNVLTIENEESFQILCRRGARSGWIFLYLAGFPSSGKLRLLKRLSEAGIAIHHWGDLDCGGIEIFRVLERRLGCKITPVAMGPEQLEIHSGSLQKLSAMELRRLGVLSEKAGPSHPLAPTIDAMLKLGCKLEQEAVIDPFA